MAAKLKIKEMNWEKITVYLTLLIAFLAMSSQLFHIKDELKDLAVSVGKMEVKIENLEEIK